MKWDFEELYSMFEKNEANLLLQGKWGLEREAQRVTQKGNLALTPHPKSLGDKQTNPEITTDFSESQLELITPPLSMIEDVYQYLERLCEKVSFYIRDERMWPLSMPPRLPKEDEIPIATFGDDAEGKMLYQYRQGLASRYGKKMQMISGIHYNFSFGDQLVAFLHQMWGNDRQLNEFRDEVYFAVARNFLRYRWLLIYLLGASPSYDKTYASVVQKELNRVQQCCPECYQNEEECYVTSYRLSRYGYSNTEQGNASIRYNSKEEYVRGIRRMLTRKSHRFANIENQLNDRILQKDSEFYSAIRLKQVTKAKETQIDAIEKRGVEYAEVRILDIDPYEKTGIGIAQLRFLQVFMLFCLMEKSPLIGRREMKRITNNHHLVALKGRKPGLRLYRSLFGKAEILTLGEDVFIKLKKIAALLDRELFTDNYSVSIRNEEQKLFDKNRLPSARIAMEMREHKENFVEFGMRKTAELHHKNVEECKVC